MTEGYGYIQAFQYYRQSQSKFDYFFIGVILASFSLSIQFNSLSNSHSIYLLVLTWVLLLISLLFGLFRIERINMFLRVEADKLSFSKKKEILETSKLQGNVIYKTHSDSWKPEELMNELSNLDNLLTSAERFLRKYNDHTLRAYQVQKWCFIYAIFSIALFKITNIICLSLFCELSILLLIVIVSFLTIYFYKQSLFSNEKIHRDKK